MRMAHAPFLNLLHYVLAAPWLLQRWLLKCWLQGLTKVSCCMLQCSGPLHSSSTWHRWAACHCSLKLPCLASSSAFKLELWCATPLASVQSHAACQIMADNTETHTLPALELEPHQAREALKCAWSGLLQPAHAHCRHGLPHCRPAAHNHLQPRPGASAAGGGGV